MEPAKYSLSTQSLNDDILLNDNSKALLASNVKFTFSDITTVNQKLNNKCDVSQGINDHINGNVEGIISCEPNLNSAVKSMSPTIIEHAFNVMKNLFSPEKGKSKPASSEVKNQQNSESPCASVYSQNKPNVHDTDSLAVDRVDDVVHVCHPESHSLEGEMNKLGVMPNSIVQDVHNITDDSFLTTVSLIDESFQSAITHLDDNEDVISPNLNSVENALNDSRFLNISGCYNEKEHSLEKTLLKNGSLGSEDIHLDNESNDSREENLETLNSTQIVNCLAKNENEKIKEVPDAMIAKISETLEECRISVNEKNEVSLENHFNLESNEQINDVLKQEELGRRSIDRSVKDLTPVKCCKDVEMENIFLNRRFENTPNEAECSKPDSPKNDCNIEGNPRGDSGEVQEELQGENAVKMEPVPALNLKDDYVDTNITVIESGKEVPVDMSFSTTTVVLTGESDELCNDRLSLTDDEYEGGRSMSTSTPSRLISPKDKQTRTLYSSPQKVPKSVTPKNAMVKSEKSETLNKSPGKKVCKSEGSSPNKSPKVKNKLNKSADVLSSSQSRDSTKRKCNSREKEVQPSKGKDASLKSTNFVSHSKSPNKEIHQEASLGEGKEVLSQESYTIINAPKSLERPVIKSGKERSDGEHDTSQNVLVDRSKQSTPICEGTRTPKLEVNKMETEKSKVKALLDFSFPSAADSQLKTALPVNEEPTEFSPVTPIVDHPFTFENSSEREGGNGSPCQSTELNSTWVLPCNRTNEMNRTYDKKPETPNALNQTYDKKEDSEVMNKLSETYDKISDGPIMNQTFNKGFDMNVTYQKEDVDKSAEMNDMDKTFSKDPVTERVVKQAAVIDDPAASVNNEENKSSRSQETKASSNDTNKTSSKCPSPPAGLINCKASRVSDLTGKFSAMNLNESSNACDAILEDKLDCSFKLQCDADLVQLIQEQFTSTDIEKICSVVEDMSAIKLSNEILKASEQFDKSFHESVGEFKSTSAKEAKFTKPAVSALSPHSFDFLNSITGKRTETDLSRQSLYVKFDPLVQAPNANSLIDFTKEGEILPTIEASPERETEVNFCEQLLTFSPQKKPDDIVPPLIPLSDKGTASSEEEDKLGKLKELQNEIFFLKNVYAEGEKTNRSKIEDYESRVAKLTGENCLLEEKLRDTLEREKSLVRKLNEQSQTLDQLKVIMEEYVKVIAKLIEELETTKQQSAKQIESLTSEKDSFVTHLQNTEAAYTDVHAKYEKSRKTIFNMKTNEALYKATLAKQAAKLEEFEEKARETQENATKEFQKLKCDLDEMKASHVQEANRLRAQVRKTELKLEALQKSLDQKIKENEQLAAIFDELVEGKK